VKVALGRMWKKWGCISSSLLLFLSLSYKGRESLSIIKYEDYACDSIPHRKYYRNFNNISLIRCYGSIFTLPEVSRKVFFLILESVEACLLATSNRYEKSEKEGTPGCPFRADSV
jgi:hypothetical protein